MSGAPGASVPERTTLAWQRTALSLLAGAAVLTRLTADQLGPFSLAGLAVVGPLALWVVGVGAGRLPQGSGATRQSRDGRPAAGLCVGVAVLAVLELVSVALGASR